MKRVQQSGFTLIELVVVIVILGILAATAIPRFADMSVQAKQAARDGVAGAVRSASAIAHAQALVENISDIAAQTITMEGSAVDMDFLYPSEVGIEVAAQVSSDVVTTVAGTVVTYTIDADTNCTVTFTASTGSGVQPVVAGVTTCT
ncbi:MAG: type II secretion system protein [Gammaproteobacteria bacterium]|nr:type II secretion system protein [Gammaproteobacteria bacterium]